MKRYKCAPASPIAALVLALLMLLTIGSSIIADAAETTADPYEDSKLTEDGLFVGMYDLYQYWKRTEFPDYVCGVWVLRSGRLSWDTGDGVGTEALFETYAVYDETDANGNRTRTHSATRVKSNIVYYFAVGVTQDEAGEAGKEEILSLIALDETAEFCYQTYPMRKMQQILKIFGDGSYDAYGLVSAHHYARGNRVDLHFDEEYENNPDTVALVERIKTTFGDAVMIDFGSPDIGVAGWDEMDGVMMGDDPEPSVSDTAVNGDPGWVLLLLLPLALLIPLVLLSRHRARLALLSSGEAVTAATRLSRKDTEILLRESAPALPSDLDKRVFEEIER